MSTPLPPAVPSGDTPPADPPKPADPAKPAGDTGLPASGVDFGDDLDKWKHWARTHEAERDRWRSAAETAQADLAKAQRASQSDAERALDDARLAGRAEGAQESREAIGRWAIVAAAARAGVEVSEQALEFINTAALVGDDNQVNTDKVGALISGFAPAAGATPAAPSLPPPDPAQRGNRTRGQGGKANPDDAMAAGQDLYRAHFPKPQN